METRKNTYNTIKCVNSKEHIQYKIQKNTGICMLVNCGDENGRDEKCSSWRKARISSSSHLSLSCEDRWGTTDDFATSFLHFFLFSTALWDLANSRPVHSLMLSSHLFLGPPCLLPPFTVPCKMVLARPDERETWPYHCSLLLFTMVSRPSCGPFACWILAWTSSLVTWSFYEIRS